MHCSNWLNVSVEISSLPAILPSRPVVKPSALAIRA
jgi:hypothetical protein